MYQDPVEGGESLDTIPSRDVGTASANGKNKV